MASCARSTGFILSVVMEYTAHYHIREIAFQAHILFPGNSCLFECHISEHTGRGSFTAPGKAAKAGLFADIELCTANRFEFHPDVRFFGHTDPRKGGNKGALFNRHTAERQRPMSPPRQSCFGALYHPSSSAYLVMAASSPASVLISDWRATETRSAPWESMSFMRSKVVM